MRSLRLYLILWLTSCLPSCVLNAASLPPSKPVHIEVRHEWGYDRLMYFWLTDLYTKEERKVKSEFLRDGVVTFDFTLYHPLYDEIIPGGNRRIPFYVEPGDTLIIQVRGNGRVERYERQGGQPVKYENLLRHDISNRMFYTQEDFAADKQHSRFPEFVNRVQQKMQVALDSVSHVGDRYGFSDEERNLARRNVQLQFGLWIFEYAPMRASELLAYASHHETGWQTTPEQEQETAAILDLANYGFVEDMQPDDSTYLASRFFPAFIQSYEHTQVMNYDQYLYAADTPADIARMDSAYVAKDLDITRQDHPSLFMNMALARRHVEKPSSSVDDGSIHLPEVQVIGSTNLDQFYRVFGKSEYNPQEVVEKAWAHDVNLKGVLSSLFNHKKIRNHKRAKKLIQQYSADDAEREALMKAWADMQKE